MEQSMREGFGRIRLKCDVLLAEKIDRLAKDNQGSLTLEAYWGLKC